MSRHRSPQTFRNPAPPSLHRVPAGRFPGFIGTVGRSDSLPSIPPHFVAFAWRYRCCAPVLRSRRRPSAAVAGQGLSLPGYPSFRVSCGGGRASQVPGEPHCGHALLSDPGGTSAPGHLGASVLPSAFQQRRLPRLQTLSRLNHTACRTRCLRFAARVTRSDARLASGCWPGFAGRDWLPAGFHRRVSELCYISFPLPRLRLAH